MHYNMLVIKFEKEYFVDLISLRLGFTTKKEKIYIDFVFLFISIYIYWLYPKSAHSSSPPFSEFRFNALVRCYERMWVSYYIDDFPIFFVGVRFQCPNSIGCSPNPGRRSRTFLILSSIHRRTNEVPPPRKFL
jgi:hypothetical protein